MPTVVFLFVGGLLVMSVGPVAGQSITTLQPESGAEGTPVRIYGSGFDSTPGNNTVTFGGTQANVDSAKANVLYVQVPSGVSGPVQVEVTTGGTTAQATERFIVASEGVNIFGQLGDDLPKGTSTDWGDYDGDGDLDLVVIGDETKIYRNDGEGTFTAIGANIEGVFSGDGAWGDYNGDGQLDLVVVGNQGFSDPSATIYRNDGNDTFTAIGAGLQGVAGGAAVSWGDYNQDGALDLAVSGGDGNFEEITTIYQNDGNGEFSAVGAGLSGVETGDIAWGDYNGDGRLDLVVTGDSDAVPGSPTATIYRNDGSGQFSEVGAGLVRVDTSSVAWGDYDGDGDLDLVVAGTNDSGEPTTTVYRNDGQGTFTTLGAGLTSLQFGAVAWGDYNADGRLDLVVTGADANREGTTTLYENTGSGQFRSVDTELALGTRSVTWGDADGDGRLDLAFTSGQATQVYRNGGPRAAQTPPSGLSASGAPSRVQLSWNALPSDDLDTYRIYRDTAPIDSSAGPSNLTAYASTSDTSFTDTNVEVKETYYYRITAADTLGNESGFSAERQAVTVQRITSIRPSTGVPGASVQIYGSGFGTTTSANTVRMGGIEAVLDSAASTRLTVQVPSGVSGPVSVEVTTGGATVTAANRFTALTVANSRFDQVETTLSDVTGEEAEWGDYDRDGDLDLALARGDSSGAPAAAIYRNDGQGTFTKLDAGLAAGRDVGWGDYDADGDLDLVVAGSDDSGGGSTLYRNEGQDTFAAVGADLLVTGPLAWGDYNSDGALDLIVVGSTPTLYRGNGSGAFTALDPGISSFRGGDVNWGDYDNDGDLDLAVVGDDFRFRTGKGQIYRNDGGGTFTAVGPDLAGKQGSADWGDYDGDGDLDLVVTGEGSFDNVTTLYRNDGNDSFVEVSTSFTGVAKGEAEWGDFEGDGDLDLALVGVDGDGIGRAATYRNEEGSFSEANVGLDGRTSGALAWGDYNGDGALDLLAVGGGSSQLHRNDPSPTSPSNVTATPGIEEIALSWDAVSARDLQRYRIYRDTEPIGASADSALTPLDSTMAGTTTFTDQAVEAGTAYYYQVTAVDEQGNESSFSRFSEEKRAIPKRPVAITDVRPESGTPGTGVRIYGRGFSSTADDNTVTFGGGQASVDSAKSNVVYTQVPSGTSGPVSVEVTTGGNTAASPNSFIAVAPSDGSFSLLSPDLQGAVSGTADWGDFDRDGDLDLVVAGFTEDRVRETVIYENVEGRGLIPEQTVIGISRGEVDWGDFDRDGDLDLIVGGDGGNAEILSVYRNDGNGLFRSVGAGLPNTGTGNIQSVAWGDYNGDGVSDLLVASEGGTAIYGNDGQGSFTEDTSLVGIGKGDASWGDYNGDGRLDLAVVGDSAGFGDSIARIYRNEGGSTFAKVGAGLSGVESGALDWGDYDGDGRLDLAVAGDSNSTESLAPSALVYRNEGGGAFTRMGTGLVGTYNSSVNWGDYDGDGRSDLVVTGFDSTGSPSTRVYRNEGSGSFTETSSLQPVSRGASVWGDLDGNGKLDLILAGTDNVPEAILYHDGSRPPGAPIAPTRLTAVSKIKEIELNWTDRNAFPFESHRIYRSTTPIDSTAGPSGLTAIDTVAAQTTSGPQTTYTDTGLDPSQTYYYRVTSVDSLGNESGFSMEAHARPKSVPLRLADAEPTSGAAGTPVRLYGAGFKPAPSNVTVSFGARTATVDSAGASVLYTHVPNGVRGPVSVSVAEEDKTVTATSLFTGVTGGTGTFQEASTDADFLLAYTAADWGDYDGDGDMDLILTGGAGVDPQLEVYRNDGNGTFTDFSTNIVPVEGDVAWGDFNNDGLLDVAITGTDQNENPTTRVYRNQGESTFTEAESLSGVVNGSLGWADYNGDGYLDLIVTGANNNQAQAVLYTNDGDGNLVAGGISKQIGANGSVDWGDYNGDGRPDLLVSGFSGEGRTTAIYRNNGSDSGARFSDEIGAGLVDVSKGTAQWGDYDADGDPDIVVTGQTEQGTEVTRVYRNDGGGTFTNIEANLPDEPRTADWGDADGDGDLDLVLDGDLYRNDGGRFVDVADGLPDQGGPVAWGDYDADGDLDLITDVSEEVDRVAVFENEGGVASTASASVEADSTVDFGSTGIDLRFAGVDSSGTVTVNRYAGGPNGADGISESNVSKYRVTIEASASLAFDSTRVQLAVSGFGGIDDPSNVTIYKRDSVGTGSFTALTTTVGTNGTSGDVSDDTLYATTTSFSEFVLASDTEPLPVELASFDAQVDGDAVTLNWMTAAETNNAGFRIQRRVGDAEREGRGEWTTVGKVSGAGTTTEAQDYRFTDANLPYEADALTYRLKQVDTDGSTHFSKTVTVERDVTEVQLLGTYPNPAGQQATVRYALPEKQDVTVRLYDVLGRRVRTVVSGKQEGRHERTLDVSGLSSGVYFLRLTAGSQIRTQKLTVVR